MTFKDDLYYIEKVLSGSVNDFSVLIDRHKDRVFNLAFRISGNREEAEEIAQDTFLKAYHSLGSFRKNAAFSTWLYRIAYNAAISCIRSRKKLLISIEELSSDPGSFPDIPENGEESYEEYRKSLLNFALGKLNEEDRGIISLYYYEDMSTEEIAFATGMSQSNVKVRLFRTRQKLLEIIGIAEQNQLVCHEKI